MVNLEEDLSEQWIDALVRVVNPRWIPVAAPFRGLRAWRNRHERLTVFCSCAPRQDGKRWVHFSVAGSAMVPSWEQLVRAKEAILGAETKAIQVLAPRSQWVDLHPHCLHLWTCLDGDSLPDFTDGTGSL